MEGYRWYYLHINPEPWAVGPLDLGRKSGKLYATMGQNQQLAAYQEAVRDELRSQDPEFIEGQAFIQAWFWRNRAEYTTPNQRKHRKHEADGTNMLKAIEDACQGVLFNNDRDNQAGAWWIVEQGAEVEGKILLRVGTYIERPLIPADVYSKLLEPREKKDDNSWPPK